jgi:hypothetical protein
LAHVTIITKSSVSVIGFGRGESVLKQVNAQWAVDDWQFSQPGSLAAAEAEFLKQRQMHR